MKRDHAIPCVSGRSPVSRRFRKHVFPASPNNRDSGRTACWRAKRSLQCVDNGAGGDRGCPAACRRDEARPRFGGLASGWFVPARAGACVRDATEAGQNVPKQEWPRSRAPRPAFSRGVQREHGAGRSRQRAGVAGRGCHGRGPSAGQRLSRWLRRPGRWACATIRKGRFGWLALSCPRVSGRLLRWTAEAALVLGRSANLEFRSRGNVFRFHSNASCVTKKLPEVGGGGQVR
jgi:hypothetical protein